MAQTYIYDPLDRRTFDALVYNAVGRASEIGTTSAYSLTHSTGNSGWSVGMVQTDLSSNAHHQQAVRELLESYQGWAPQDQQLSSAAIASLNQRLNKGGQNGNSLTATEQVRLDSYLRSDAGRALVRALDQRQIDRTWKEVGEPLSHLSWMQNLRKHDPAESAEIIAMAVKLYNQNENKGSALLRRLQEGSMTAEQTKAWIGSSGVHHLNPYARAAIVSGRDNALSGAALMNALELGNGHLSQTWRSMVHTNDDPALSTNFNNNPDAQLLDAMMRDPTSGMRIFRHVDHGESVTPVAIHGLGGGARQEMARVELDAQGVLTLQSPSSDHFVRTQSGWAKVAQPHRVLEVGLHGDDVEGMQRDLRKLGYLEPRDADGRFGPHTRSAVERFQRDHHLTVDGIAGPKTQHVLANALHARTQGLLEAEPRLSGFDDPAHPQHAVHAALKPRMPPGTSGERLAQCTAACHAAGLDRPEHLGQVYVTDTKALFLNNSLFGHMAEVDLTRPPPPIEQSLQQAEQHSRRQEVQPARFPRPVREATHLP